MTYSDNLVISYDDFLDDPTNEGKTYAEYLDEICHADTEAFLVEEIRHLETEYIEHKNTRYGEDLKIMIGDLKAAYSRIKKRLPR